MTCNSSLGWEANQQDFGFVHPFSESPQSSLRLLEPIPATSGWRWGYTWNRLPFCHRTTLTFILKDSSESSINLWRMLLCEEVTDRTQRGFEPGLRVLTTTVQPFDFFSCLLKLSKLQTNLIESKPSKSRIKTEKVDYTVELAACSCAVYQHLQPCCCVSWGDRLSARTHIMKLLFTRVLLKRGDFWGASMKNKIRRQQPGADRVVNIVLSSIMMLMQQLLLLLLPLIYSTSQTIEELLNAIECWSNQYTFGAPCSAES